jgi:polyisoprenoid-binding protein YceI
MKKMSKWVVDQSKGQFTFKVRNKMLASVIGKFKSFETTIYTSPNTLKAAQINFWIDVSSIVTDDKDQNEMLKSPIYLNQEQHKLITFVSTNIGDTDVFGNYELEGYLSIKGISKIVKLNIQLIRVFKGSTEIEGARFKITGKINRSDWGIGWNPIIETTGLMLSEEISINYELALKQIGEKVVTLEQRAEHKMKQVFKQDKFGVSGDLYSVN